MSYFERVKEIQQLQWALFVDYWYVHIGLMIIGIFSVAAWILKK